MAIGSRYIGGRTSGPEGPLHRPIFEELEPRLMLSADLIGWASPSKPDFHFQLSNDQGIVEDLHWGERVIVRYGVNNTGDLDAGPFFNGFVLSADATIGDADDYDLTPLAVNTNDLISGLDAGENKSSVHVFSLPTSPPPGFPEDGVIYVGVKIDCNERIDENSDTNNCNQGVGIDKSGPIPIESAEPNMSPTINLTAPSGPLTVQQGDTVEITWTAADPDDQAWISIAYDPDTGGSPWSGPANHTNIELTEELDGQGNFLWHTSAVEPGVYSVWAKVKDPENPDVYDRAAGLVTVQSLPGEFAVHWGGFDLSGGDTVDFGRTTTSVYETVTIENTGTQNVTITGIQIDSTPIFVAASSLAPGDNSDDRTLAPGETLAVSLCYSPDNQSPDSGMLTILSSNAASYVLNLKGEYGHNPVLIIPGTLGSLPGSGWIRDWLLNEPEACGPEALIPEWINKTYNPLIDAFEKSGYSRGDDLFFASYDWRRPIGMHYMSSDGYPDTDQYDTGTGILLPDNLEWSDQSVVYRQLLGDDIGNIDSGVEYLTYWINEAKKQSGATKVDLVAHSMGGLVARAYIQSDYYQYLQDVNSLITLGTPHYGSVEMAGVWYAGKNHRHGRFSLDGVKNFGLQIVNAAWKAYHEDPTKVQKISDVNIASELDFLHAYFPGARDLLPVFQHEYQLDIPGYPEATPLRYDSAKNRWLDTLNGSDGIMALAERATVTCLGGVLDLSEPKNGTPYAVVWDPGHNTLLSQYSIPLAGDGTVLFDYHPTEEPTFMVSAILVADGIESNIDSPLNVGHGDLPSDPTAIDRVLTALGRSSLNGSYDRSRPTRWGIGDAYTKFVGIAQQKRKGLVDKVVLWAFIDPADFVLVDPLGRRVGVTEELGLLNEIPNAFLVTDGLNDYVVIPDPMEGEYDLTLHGLGEEYTAEMGLLDLEGNLLEQMVDVSGVLGEGVELTEPSIVTYLSKVYVDPEAPGANDGSSWDNAYHDLQDALADARAGGVDEIWVADGTYVPGVSTSGTFELSPGVPVFGGFGGYTDGQESYRHERDWTAHPTVLSGDINGDDDGYENKGDNASSVVTAEEGGFLDGFTITGGYSIGDGGAYGGGLWITGGATTVRNTTFIRNRAGSGGAIYNYSAELTLDNCLVIANYATLGGAIAGDGDTTITGCTFSGNRSASADFIYAGHYSDIDITNSIIDGRWGIKQPSLYYGTISINYSLIDGGWPSGVGNIDAAPLFVDSTLYIGGAPVDGDFRLRPGSPCIDAANGDAALLTDARGSIRYDDPHTTNTGTGSPDYSDMGAFEYGGELSDLVLDDVSYVTGEYTRGDTFDMQFTEENTGNLPVGASTVFEIEVRLSTDQVWSEDDLLLSSFTEDNGLAAPETRLVETLGTVPYNAPAGSYYVAVRIDSDDVVEESAEDNTVWSSAADVIVSGAQPPQGVYEVWGGDTWYGDLGFDDWYNIDERDYVKLGEATGDATFTNPYDYYAIVSNGPILLDAIQASDGEYKVGFGLTGNVYNPENNLAGPPDGLYGILGAYESSQNFDGFIALDGGYSGIRIITNNEPDLVVGPADSRWIVCQPGGQVTVSVDVINQGSAETGVGFEGALYLSSDNVISADDTKVIQSQRGNLSGGQSDSFRLTFDAPVQTGVYYLAVCADASDAILNESFEDNNWGQTIELIVGDGEFEFDITRIYYQDGTGREIDYDFSSGLDVGGGAIQIPSSAVIGRPEWEEETEYYWIPAVASQQLDTGSGVATVRGHYGGAYFDGDSSPAGASLDWTFETTIDRFEDINESGILYSVYLGCSPDGNAVTGLAPEIWAGWFTGIYQGTFYDNVLVVGMDVGDLAGPSWEADFIPLMGLDPENTVLDLRLEVAGGNVLTGMYRVNGEDWGTVAEYTASSGQFLSYDQRIPYVWLTVEEIDPDGGSISPDGFESNDDQAHAADLGSEGQTQTGLNIDVRGDEDWFAWQAPSDGVLDVDLMFIQSESGGNLDLYVYDASETLLGSSATETDDETVSIALVGGQTCFIQVVGFNGDTSADYELVIEYAHASAEPGMPNLVNVSDTGRFADDDLTNLNNMDEFEVLLFEISGTAPNAEVTVYIDGQARGQAIATGPTTIVTTDGAFELVDGSHSVTAVQTEPGKLASVSSLALVITIDTESPGTPDEPDLQSGSDTGVFTDDNITRDNTPTFDVSASPYFCFYRDGAPIGETYQTGPVYAASLQEDGSYQYAVAAVDAAGNETMGAALSVTIDTQAPSVAVDQLLTRDSSPLVSGVLDEFAAWMEIVINGVAYTDVVGNDGQAWFLPNNAITPPLGNDVYDVAVTATDISGNEGSDATSGELTIVTTEVVARDVFYNNSVWDVGGDDDAAIALDKSLLLPGGTPSPANYTSYSRGINGIMVDIDNATGAPTSDDFGIGVNEADDPDAWSDGPIPIVSVRPGEGVGGSDRVTLTWPDGEILNQWVEVTVKSGGNTGLAANDVFYFGSAVADADGDGQTGDSDIDVFKSQFGLNGVGLGADFNNDGYVGLDDFVSLRSNFDNTVMAPTIPSPAPATAPTAPDELVSGTIGLILPIETDEAFYEANDSTSALALALTPVSDLLVESLSPGSYIPEPRPISQGKSPLAATTEYDLRPLSNDLGVGEADDLLADILAESALALPL